MGAGDEVGGAARNSIVVSADDATTSLGLTVCVEVEAVVVEVFSAGRVVAVYGRQVRQRTGQSACSRADRAHISPITVDELWAQLGEQRG